MNQLTHSVQKIALGTSISLFFGLFGYGLMFFTKLLAARHFGPTDYGQYEMATTILLVVIVFSAFGLPAATSRFVPVYRHSNDLPSLKGFLFFAFSLTLILSLLAAGALFFSAPYLTRILNFPQAFTELLKITSFIIPLRAFSQILRRLLIAESRVFLQSFSENFLERVILLVGTILAVALKLPLAFLLGVLLIASLVSLLFEILVLAKIFQYPKIKKQKILTREWILFSLPLVLSGFFSFFIQWSDNILVGSLLSATALGIYAIAYSLGDFVGFLQVPFMGIFSTVIGEKFAKKLHSEITDLFTGTTNAMLFLSMLLFVIFSVTGRDLLFFFYGPEFAQGYIPLLIVSGALVLYNAAGLNENILILYSQTKALLYINIAASVLNIALNFLLIPLWGLVGAAIASAIALNTKSLTAHILARNHLGGRLRPPHLLRILTASLPALLCGHYFSTITPPSITLTLAAGLITAVLYILSSYMLGTIPKVLLSYLRSGFTIMS